MKKIEAFIRHEAFEPIRMELLELGFPSLSISEVKGSGRQKGITERYRGAEVTNYLRPKVKIECGVSDRDVQTIVDSILKHARTGAVGEGGLFYTGSFGQLWGQFVGVVAAFVFVFAFSFLTFWLIKKTYGLRVSAEEEDAGLDISEHGMYGYPEQFIPAPELVGYSPAAAPVGAAAPKATTREVPA